MELSPESQPSDIDGTQWVPFQEVLLKMDKTFCVEQDCYMGGGLKLGKRHCDSSGAYCGSHCGSPVTCFDSI